MATKNVFLAGFPDGFRTVYADDGIEQVFYLPEGHKNRKKLLRQYFGKAPNYELKTDAVLEGKRLMLKYNLEDIYSITDLGEFEAFV
jgi:hypothetical protein